jgi:hypothetical protein
MIKIGETCCDHKLGKCVIISFLGYNVPDADVNFISRFNQYGGCLHVQMTNIRKTLKLTIVCI